MNLIPQTVTLTDLEVGKIAYFVAWMYNGELQQANYGYLIKAEAEKLRSTLDKTEGTFILTIRKEA